MPDKDDTTRVHIIAADDWLAAVDAWRAKQRGLPNRSEAIRRLVQLALESEGIKLGGAD